MLIVKDLVCGYPETSFFLKNINVSVSAGDFLGIIGPNGAGKSTLFRVLTRRIIPEQGEISLNGRDIRHYAPDELARIIAVAAPLSHIPLRMTVAEYVLLGRTPHRAGLRFFESSHDREIADQSMQLTDTVRFADRYLETLSSGERQLVVIARALAQEPKLLLLDEPVSHLDIAHQAIILDLLRKLNRDPGSTGRQPGLTVMVILHDLNLASEYCDRIMLLSNGDLFKLGTPQEVITYQNIEPVYKTVVVTAHNPISKKPYVFPVPASLRDNR